jgi:hypothetical protein
VQGVLSGSLGVGKNFGATNMKKSFENLDYGLGFNGFSW